MADDPYERGRADGEISQRLNGHDQHFALLNGQLSRVASALTEMNVRMAEMGSRQQNIIDTTNATQQALKNAAEARWSVWQKLFAVIGVIVAIAGLYFAYRAGK